MKSNEIKISVLSISSLLSALLFIYILRNLVMVTGGWLAGVNGQLEIEWLEISIVSDSWTSFQVISVYLMPLMVLFVLLLIIGRKLHYPLKTGRYRALLKAWLYFLLILEVCLLPAIDIFFKGGLYTTLLWLELPKIDQYILGIILLVFFINGSGKLGPFYSAAVDAGGYIIKDKRTLLKQTIFIVVVPSILLIISSIIWYLFSPDFNGITFIIVVVYLSSLTTWQILNYDVIVK